MGRGTIGMTPEELTDHLDAMLLEEAQEAAAARGTTPAEELASPGFAAAHAASTYTIKLIHANNAYIARFLLDRGILESTGDE